MPSTAASHPVRTPFGVTSTAAEVLHGVDLSGRHVVVDRRRLGLGAETARALAAAGAQVTLAVRDLAAGRSAAETIMGAAGRRSILTSDLWTWPTSDRSPHLRPTGRDRSMSWSTTPG